LLVEIKQYTKYYLIMNYSFEYMDIILLAMIAGFIFLRLSGILGKRTGFDGKLSTDFKQEIQKETTNKNLKIKLLMILQSKSF